MRWNVCGIAANVYGAMCALSRPVPDVSLRPLRGHADRYCGVDAALSMQIIGRARRAINDRRPMIAVL
jgi:hypothetical protein